MIAIYVSVSGKINYQMESPEKEAIAKASMNALYKLITRNFRSLGGAKFWGDAVKSTEVQQHGDVASLTVSHKGVRLQYLGGTVRPTGKISEITGKPIKTLLVPLKGSPLKNKSLKELPIDRDSIKVIPREGKSSLLAAITGKGKKAQLTPLAVLLKQTTITPDDRVFPSIQTQVDAIQTQTNKTLKQLLK